MMLGLRPGELTGLRWKDIDLKEGHADGRRLPHERTRAAAPRCHKDEAVKDRDALTSCPGGATAQEGLQKEERLKVGPENF